MEKEFLNQPQVSVIIPVYNVEKYIERCLNSVVSQTLKNIEIIIINDGSTDNSSSVIENYLSDKRVIYVKQENKGLSCARNKGLDLAHGEFISFVDSDDYIEEDFLQKLYTAAVQNKAEVAASSIVRVHETYEKWRVHYKRTHTVTNKSELAKLIKYPEQSYVWNKIYKKSFLDEINYRFQEGVFYEDILATLSVVLACKRLVVVADTNYYYMVNDGNSIVKSKKNQKKETDRYKNQHTAIKTLIKEGIKIPKKEYFVKKYELECFNFTILKMKENLLENKDLFLLFGFIPLLYIKKKTILDMKIFAKQIFSVSVVDFHIVLMFLFIKLKIKLKTKPKTLEINTFGLNCAEGRPKKIIASVTSFPERIGTVSYAIKTIMNQTVKADEIVLYLGKDQFARGENSLPKDLLALKEYGLKIKWTKDIKSYKKLIPALCDYPDDVIITFDDDIYYESDTIESLWNAYLKEPDDIHSNRIWRLEFKKEKLKPLNSAYLLYNWKEFQEPTFFNTIIGCGGVLYPPNSLNEEVFNEKKFTKIIPTQDDVWFWAMGVLNGVRVRQNKGYSCVLQTIEGTQGNSLAKINNKEKTGVSGAIAFKKVIKEYPQILDILKNEAL